MLIKLVSIHPAPSPQSVPLATAFLKSYAKKSSVTVDMADFFLGNDPLICATALADNSPVAIGFSIYLWNVKLSMNIASELKRIAPAIKLFCGGPEVTANPEFILKSEIFDFAVTAEGELPFLSLCQAFEEGREFYCIPGVISAEDIKPATSTPIADLDSIPSPYLNGVINVNSTPGLLWQLSRGCSFTCDFCFDSRGIHGVRHFSLERVESELHYFAANGVRQIFVLDSTFNINPKRAKKILRLIKKVAPEIHFHFEVRNEFIDREMAQLFAEIQCSLQIGLQSSNPDTLKLVGRSFNKADFSSKTALLNDCGATFGFDLIYGLPGDTLAGFIQSLDYALSLYPNHLDIFQLAVLPGTRLSDNGERLGLNWDKNPPYLIESTINLSKEDIKSASRLGTACDIFYTRGKAVAWFNSVTKFLRLKPSELLDKFGKWMLDRNYIDNTESDFTDNDVWDMQQFFLRELLSRKKLVKYYPLILDVMKYHHFYAEVLLSPGGTNDTDHKIPADIWSCKFKLAPSVHIINFSYDIEELLDFGEPQIPRMFDQLQQSGSQAFMYLNNGRLCSESIDAPYLTLLENIRDKGYIPPPPEASLEKSEILEFISFALQEGILLND
ncbi:MAG: B12-binding domain-containing radical SAM protein [Desulfuromonadaceae bacterium]|nr:B12-binding domain-containing radical SAM protein [Desulfuromonadaceae bacterium]MDD2854892.1 B12-binding domain-containing radical SAM protein [Desulfuromonadaceae bacterium]